MQIHVTCIESQKPLLLDFAIETECGYIQKIKLLLDPGRPF